jgi:hypothetical protein
LLSPELTELTTLQLAGVHDNCIAIDYSLTRIGREAVREKILAQLRREPMFSEDNQRLLNMFQCRYDTCVSRCYPELTVLYRVETMIAFLHLLDERYGGENKYLMSHVGLSEEDLAMIRRNIISQ